MCLYFSYGGHFHEQKEGGAMAPRSLHEVFLALEMAPTRPRLWKKYVDDTFCILRKGSAEELLCHLNGVRPTIKFIVDQAAWT